MKLLPSILFAFIFASCLQAQDTFFTLAKAPLAITRDVQTQAFTLKNTSDKPLQRIKLFSAHHGQYSSVVIIEELGPHQTVTYDISSSLAVGANYREASITCAHYSIPIRLNQY